jgi:hypothetical protein
MECYWGGVEGGSYGKEWYYRLNNSKAQVKEHNDMLIGTVVPYFTGLRSAACASVMQTYPPLVFLS